MLLSPEQSIYCLCKSRGLTARRGDRRENVNIVSLTITCVSPYHRFLGYEKLFVLHHTDVTRIYLLKSNQFFNTFLGGP